MTTNAKATNFLTASGRCEQTNINASEKNDSSVIFLVADIKTAQENDLLYEGFGIANEDDLGLALSIQETGIKEPLVLSADGYLLSGHRRLAAARCLGLETVPVRFIDVVFAKLPKAERLKELRLFNQQREKTSSEKIREELLQIDPNEAYETLLRHRAQQSVAAIFNVDMGTIKQRARITTMQFQQAAQQIIAEHEEYWPLTVRRVHYLLLNNPPLKHDKKPGSRYGNDKASYQALTRLLIRARLAGIISMKSIEDTTRPIQLGGGFSSCQKFIKQESKYFLRGYSRDLMQGQPCHIEIMIEKNALRTVIEKVARKYCIPVTTGRGYASLSPRYDLFSRFKNSGKKKLILLMLTDFDPDGEEIASSFARSLRDDFHLENIEPHKVALTYKDTEEHDFPSDMDAKISSPNYVKFFNKFGTNKAVELDAAPVELLQEKLRKAIKSVIDVNEFNAQIDLEMADATEVEAYRKTVLRAIGGAV